MHINRFALLSTLLGTASYTSAVEYSGKPSRNNNIRFNNPTNQRRLAKSGKVGKSGTSDEGHGGDMDFSGRFSGSNMATYEQVVEESTIPDDRLDKMTTAEIDWKFDDGFASLMYRISISPAVMGNFNVRAGLYCATAGSEIPSDQPGNPIYFGGRPIQIDGDFVFSEGNLEQDFIDEGTYDASTVTMFVTDCLGMEVNNFVSLYQAMKDGSVSLLVKLDEFDSQNQVKVDGKKAVVRGQIFVM